MVLVGSTPTSVTLFMESNMAYRPLEVNDRVKIMQKGHVAFGTFGTVVKVSGDLVDVKMGD